MERHGLGIIEPVDVEKLCLRIGMSRRTYFEKNQAVGIEGCREGLRNSADPGQEQFSGVVRKGIQGELRTEGNGIFPKDDTEFGCDWLNPEV